MSKGVHLEAFRPAPVDEAVRLELGDEAGSLVLWCGVNGISHALDAALARLRVDPDL